MINFLKANFQICEYTAQAESGSEEKSLKNQRNDILKNLNNNTFKIKNEISLIFDFLFRSCLSMS